MAEKGHTNPVCSKPMGNIGFLPEPSHLTELHVPFTSCEQMILFYPIHQWIRKGSIEPNPRE
jgi:hypothetical protein